AAQPFPTRRRLRARSRTPRRAHARTRRPSAPSSAGRSRAPRPRPRPRPGRRRARPGGSAQYRRLFPVPRDRPREALVEVALRLEPEPLPRLLDVRDPEFDVGVVERPEDDLAGRAGQPLHPLREVEDRHGRARVADVEGLTDGLVSLEAQQQRIDHVVDIAPGADLRAVAVNREVTPANPTLHQTSDPPPPHLSL